MRTIAPALLLILTSCGRGDPAPNQLVEQPGPQRPASAPAAGPVVTIAASGPGGGSASWDGQAATPAQITERGIVLLERTIEAAGGVRGLTEDLIPAPNVEAPADMSMACAETVLFALQRSGFVTLRVRPAGGQAVPLDFPLGTDAPPPPIPTVLGLGAGGQLTWNNDPIDQAGLAAQLTRIGGPPGEEEPTTAGPRDVVEMPPPGGLELRVTREATFGQLHALLRTTGRYQLRPVVYLPSAETVSPSPAAPPRSR